MRKFRITVQGKAYEVEVEEIAGAQSAYVPAPAPVAVAPVAAAAPAVVAAAPVVQAAPEPAPVAAAPAAPVSANATKVMAPMPGTIVGIKVKDGDTVQAGDTLVVLEAMKMENEIMAAVGGRVTVHTTNGTTVNAGDLLAVIE